MTSAPSGTFPLPAAITAQMAGRAADEPGDAELMRLTASGDRDAFAALYRRHQASIFRFARLMTGSSAAAEDVVQEVFLALMRDPRRYDPAQAQLSTYLYGIARRHTRRRLLRDRRFVALDGADTSADSRSGSSDLHAALGRQHDLERLRRAILTLPSRYREVLVLCDLETVSYAEAAVSLRCPVGTVRSRLSRARAMLADRMTRAEHTRAQAAAAAAPVRCLV